MSHGRLYKSRQTAWNAGKPLISGIHIFPTPVILVDVISLHWSAAKNMMRCLPGQISSGGTLHFNLHEWSTLKQPHGGLYNFSQNLLINVRRFCLTCGNRIICEVSRWYCARASVCFASPFLILDLLLPRDLLHILKWRKFKMHAHYNTWYVLNPVHPYYLPWIPVLL